MQFFAALIFAGYFTDGYRIQGKALIARKLASAAPASKHYLSPDHSSDSGQLERSYYQNLSFVNASTAADAVASPSQSSVSKSSETQQQIASETIKRPVSFIQEHAILKQDFRNAFTSAFVMLTSAPSPLSYVPRPLLVGIILACALFTLVRCSYCLLQKLTSWHRARRNRMYHVPRASSATSNCDRGADPGPHAKDHGFVDPGPELKAGPPESSDKSAAADHQEHCCADCLDGTARSIADAEEIDSVNAQEEAVQAVVQAAGHLQLLKAAQMMEDAQIQPLDASLPEGLADVIKRAKRVRSVLQNTSTDGPGWKRFDMELCAFWRRWDPETQALNMVLSWEAEGSLLQQIAVIRDAEVAEPLWNGACWQMWAQHAMGASLVGWLQKDPFTGKKTEVIVERVLCDCLDEALSCWVLLERSPDIDGWEDFLGSWGPFDIPAKPKGFCRSVVAPSGRIIEPISPNSARITMALSLELPAIVRWAVTDRVLTLAIRLGSKGNMKSWKNIINSWNSSGYNERMREQAAFYEPIEQRFKKYLDRSSNSDMCGV